ncbi:MAG: carboxylate-amine ligase [Gammaproteobacteria bacterium]|nr:carboxylate-amine ligase [Gammaproteobacteria bacterium]MDP6615782.1 carboxylate-amine ligase [Gammaproteobacteria bacterium]MDP6695532.1 carboxylate-amine ligase [Gammaproteobacteria bacterium]
MQKPSFTLGIEEEYLLVDLETMDLAIDPPASLLSECRERCHRDEQVSRELLRSQIEVGTRKCYSVEEAREDLTLLRRVVVEVANEHGLAPIASSTHPYALWAEQKQTPRDRYINLSAQMQATARRMVICGMHVHVGIDDDELSIDLLSQMTYFLPHLLALSTSSPFWEGQETGLKSYRVTIFDALPRTGLPEYFTSHAEYQRHIDVLVNAGLIEDATMIWWDLRPSARYPTLETRIFDMCTHIDDAVCLAALTRCLLRTLYRLRLDNQSWRRYNWMLLNENRWRAMRYGIDEGLLDLAKGELVEFSHLLEEIIELIREDAEAFGCTEEVEHARVILERGTSAHQQTRVYEDALEAGSSPEEAARAVVAFLVAQTADGI